MAQHRKKSTSFQKQKIVRAQFRNEFIHKLKHVVDAINGGQVSSSLPPELINKLFNRRIRSFRIIASPDCTVPHSIINQARKIISAHTKEKTITVIPGKLETSLDEFVTIVLTVALVLSDILKDDYPALMPLRKRIDEFINDLENILNEANDHIYNMLLALGLCMNDMRSTVYWLNYEVVACPDIEKGLENGLMDNLISINTYKIESRPIVADSIPRPALRMGYVFPNYGIDWITFNPSELKIEKSESGQPLDVYIQNHALQRLSERIDCFNTGIIQYNLFMSLKFPSVYHDNNGKILIEYRFNGTRAGYFMVDLIDEKIIIRTFLFITNNGTPEGRKLGSITGLQKLDKKYLELDKLSTFMTTDIGENETVREIFTSAGCGCLLELYENAHGLLTNTPRHFDAEFLLRYIENDTKSPPSRGRNKSIPELCLT